MRGGRFGIVIDQQPGRFRAGLAAMASSASMDGAVALGDVFEAGDQAAAQRDEVVERVCSVSARSHQTP